MRLGVARRVNDAIKRLRPTHIRNAIRCGRFNHMPLMNGNTADETDFGLAITEYFCDYPATRFAPRRPRSNIETTSTRPTSRQVIPTAPRRKSWPSIRSAPSRAGNWPGIESEPTQGSATSDGSIKSSLPQIQRSMPTSSPIRRRVCPALTDAQYAALRHCDFWDASDPNPVTRERFRRANAAGRAQGPAGQGRPWPVSGLPTAPAPVRSPAAARGALLPPRTPKRCETASARKTACRRT